MAGAPKRKSAKQSLKEVMDREKPAPWKSCDWEVADAAAIQALVRGDATPEQQQRAIGWIIKTASGYYDDSYRPGPDGDRATNYALGRSYVGRMIVTLGKIGLSKLRELETHHG